MAVYIVGMVASVALLFLADRCRGVLDHLLAACALAVPCLIAALRDSTVGTDTGHYPTWMFSGARGMTLHAFLQYWYADQRQPIGFTLMSWMVGRAGLPYPVYLFILQALVVLPIYYVLRRMSPHFTWLGMLCYITIIFPFSLNIVKQAIAASLVLLSWYLYSRARYVPCAAVLLLAVTMHQTAMLAVVVYLLYHCICASSKPISDARQMMMIAVSVLAIAATAVLGGTVVSLLVRIRYTYSYIADNQSAGAGFNETGLVVALAVVFAIVFYVRPVIIKADGVAAQQANMAFFLAFMTLLGWNLLQLGVVGDGLSRVALYGLYFMPCFVSVLDTRDADGRIVRAAFIALMLLSFLRMLLSGSMGIYPYTSQILGI